jgi:hypothetical protein
MRPPRDSSNRAETNRVRGRVRNLERRFGANSEPILHGVCLEVSSAPDIAPSTETIIDWDTARWDTDGFWSISPHPSRVTLPFDGAYHIWGHWEVQAFDDSDALQEIVLNGSVSSLFGTSAVVVAGRTADFDQTAVFDFSAGDYIEKRVYQTQSVDINANLGQILTVTYLGPIS